MIFNELYNANFRFALRCAGAEMTDGGMGGECRMAGVAAATPTLSMPHQHFALLSLLATPTLTCWLTILCFGHTNFGNHPPPMDGGFKHPHQVVENPEAQHLAGA